MENGVAFVEGAQLGGRNGVEEEDMESRVEEMHVVVSDELKESEGDDEVFEEAVSGDTPGIIREGRVDGEEIEELDAGNEVDKFEEAVGVSSEDQKDGEKEEGLVREESSPDKNTANKPNGGEENGFVVNEEKEATDSAGEAEDLEDGDRVGQKLGQSFEKIENGAVDHSGFDEKKAYDPMADVISDQQGDQGNEPLGTQNANEVKGGNTEVESNRDILHQDEENAETNETDNDTSARLQGDNCKELENASPSLYTEHQGYPDEVQEDISIKVNVELEGKDSPNIATENQYYYDKEREIVQASNASATEHHERSPEPDNNLQPSLKERAEAQAIERELSLEYSMIRQVEKIGVGSSGSEGSEPHLPGSSVDDSKFVTNKPENKDEIEEKNQTILHNSAGLVAESSDGSQPGLVDAKGEVVGAVVKEPEKTDEDREVIQVNQSSLQNGDQNVRPAANASLMTSIPATPARPAGLGNSPLATREEQVKPTTDISLSSIRSANSAPAQPRPAGLGRAAPLLEPASRVTPQSRVNGTASPLQNQLVEDPTNGDAEETDETREKLQMIRVKFLRLAHRLGQTPHNVVVAQVLYRLGLAEQLRGRNDGRVAAFSFDRASAMAQQLEAAGQEPLDFSCTIMVLGKTGVGKSATINSIFDETKFGTDAFQLGTKKVQDVVGTVQGIKVRVIDTPGLLPSWSDQRKNMKILQSVKQYINRTPPDIILYLDRLDMPSREFGDVPLLRTITEIFGPSIWFNAIVVLTHAASAPPEGPNGAATSYDMFVTQRSHGVQQAIRQAAGDMRLMNPISLVENHSACRTNRAGQRVLPNGQVWKPHLLLLSFASKILAEASALLKLPDSPPGKPFASRSRSPPLPFLLSSLLQSKSPVKLPGEQFSDDDNTLDDDLDESSDMEDEAECEELPPFKSLTKAQLTKLPRDQRKAYYDELEYRERIFMKKQLKEEKKQRKMMKKMQAAANDLPTEYRENEEAENGGVASVSVPMPDLALPASFDSDNPTHRYRCLDSSNQWLVRPVLEPNGWDHDVGYEGINAERLFVVKEKIPLSFSGQVSKDKKDTNLQMEIASTVKHAEGKATSVGFDLQSVGKDTAYTLRSETRFSNWRKNKAVAGLSVTFLGDILTGGLKVEDKLIFNKQGQLVVSAGAVVGRGDVAYGGSLEATLRDKDHPFSRFLTTLGLSVMDWHGDLAVGCNLQSQIPVGRTSNIIGRVNVNNRGSGQVSIRVNSSEHLQIVFISFVPLVRKLLSYYEPVLFG
ncbi:hypothetical protein ACH5RR_002432 [Cinchona calisaya]|uniref:AIG1-type G domain-containing protein n=1 Tax=Cinchona calisaya TaxID=153742 RepID=A0ABD3B6K1_9GENT